MLVPATAQDLGGLQMTLGVEQRFEAGDNLSLEVPSTGSSAVATTKLNFTALTETRTQKLKFVLGGALRGGDVADDVATGFVDPRIGLGYSRTGANALLSFGASYRESDVSFNRSLSDFENEDGDIELPEDFENLNEFGTRHTTRANVRVETGLHAPVGFVFYADGANTTYSDTSATSTLDDYYRAAAGATVLFRFSEITTAFIDAKYDRYTSENAANEDRRTTSISVGADHAISSTTQLIASLGYSKTDTEEFGLTDTQEGVIGGLDWVRQLANGSVNSSLDVEQNQNGRRSTLLFGRMMNLPLGSLSYDIGVTESDSFDPNVVGGLRWQQELPTGDMFARVDRRIATNSDDDERLLTTVAVGYSYDITQLSSIDFNASFGASEFDNANDVERTDFSVSYSHEIARDWRLNAGVRYRIRDEQTVGTAESQSVFVSLRRDFDLLR